MFSSCRSCSFKRRNVRRNAGNNTFKLKMSDEPGWSIKAETQMCAGDLMHFLLSALRALLPHCNEESIPSPGMSHMKAFDLREIRK